MCFLFSYSFSDFIFSRHSIEQGLQRAPVKCWHGTRSCPHRAPGQCQAFKGRASGNSLLMRVQVRVFPWQELMWNREGGSEAETAAGDSVTARWGSSTDPSVSSRAQDATMCLAPRLSPGPATPPCDWVSSLSHQWLRLWSSGFQTITPRLLPHSWKTGRTVNFFFP